VKREKLASECDEQQKFHFVSGVCGESNKKKLFQGFFNNKNFYLTSRSRLSPLEGGLKEDGKKVFNPANSYFRPKILPADGKFP
jgi:hypothetical protein